MSEIVEPVTVLCRDCKITLITMSRRSDWKNDRDFDLCTKCIIKDMENEKGLKWNE